MAIRKQRRWLSIPSWTWAHRLTAAAFWILLVLAQQDWFPWLAGTPTGTQLAGLIPFVDPLSAVELALASHSLTITVVIGMAATCLIAAVFGRVFCGWLCPLGLVLELNGQLREFIMRRFAAHPADAQGIQLPRSVKYWVLVACLVASLVASVPVFTAFSPINLILLSLLFAPAIGLAIVGSMMLVELFLPRAFCRSICPLGALYSLLGRFARLKVRVRAGGEQMFCHQCTLRCPMGIRVMEDHVLADARQVDDPECTRCGTCTDVCAGDLLHLGLRDDHSVAETPDCVEIKL